jgi:hypothetical protein
VEEGIRSMSAEIEQLAHLVLEAANRTQGRGTTVRLIVPSASEVRYELGSTFGEHELLAAEEYLLERGHIAPADIAGLTWGTYTITQAGLEWLEEGFSDEEAALESTLAAEVEEERHQLDELERELDEVRREPTVAYDTPGAAQAVTEGPGRAEPRSSTRGPQKASEPLLDTTEVPICGESLTRPWWRRVFSG